MIFDTHCHYNLEPLFADWQTAWQTAQNYGVIQTAVIGTDFQTSQQAIAMNKVDSRLHAVIGFHPSEFQELVKNNPTLSTATLTEKIQTQLQSLTTLANQSTIVSIGETGLDYFHLPEDPIQVALIKQLQIDAFIWQIELAHQQAVPLVIHVRDQSDEAYWEVIKILKQHHRGQQPFILHCISGPIEYLKAALELGAYVGMAGNSTYKKADQIRSLIKLTPSDRLLLETDAPFLPPEPYRGQVCQPWMITQTAAFLSEEFNLNQEELYQNSLALFGQA